MHVGKLGHMLEKKKILAFLIGLKMHFKLS